MYATNSLIKTSKFGQRTREVWSYQPLFRKLNWLRETERVNFRLAVLAYRCFDWLAPSCLRKVADVAYLIVLHTIGPTDCSTIDRASTSPNHEFGTVSILIQSPHRQHYPYSASIKLNCLRDRTEWTDIVAELLHQHGSVLVA